VFDVILFVPALCILYIILFPANLKPWVSELASKHDAYIQSPGFSSDIGLHKSAYFTHIIESLFYVQWNIHVMFLCLSFSSI